MVSILFIKVNIYEMLCNFYYIFIRESLKVAPIAEKMKYVLVVLG